MPKDEWGLKRTCPECQTRFYDLTNNPMICPSCGTELTPESLAPDKNRVEKTQAAAAPEKPASDDIIDEADTTIEADDDSIDDALLDDDDDDDTVSLEELSDRPAADDDET